jgi:FkbM family methyltransferase
VRQICSDLTHMRTAVDIGAHIGLWSFNLCHWFKRVEAFEPVENHRACFEKNLLGERTGLAALSLHAVALGAHEGKVGMSVNPTSTGDSWVKGTGEIPLRTLDSFGLEDVDLIKIDAEGYEENIVRGAGETIARCRPVVIVEQKRDMASKFGLQPQGAVVLLKSMGYRQHVEIGGDYIMVPA